jgi:hypothetical protein
VITGTILSASKVLDTAINVTDARSRRASLQALTIPCSTAASPVGEGEVSGDGFCGLISSFVVNLRGISNFIEFRKGFLNPPL